MVPRKRRLILKFSVLFDLAFAQDKSSLHCRQAFE
jgi:hypothetical protein